MQDGAIPPLELGSVPDTDLLELLGVEWRRLSAQQARVWSVMAELATRDPMAGVPGAVRWTPVQIAESAVDEIRAELLLTRRAAGTEVDHATNVAALPRVAAALAAGVLDRRRAIMLAETCVDLAPEHVEALLDEILPSVGDCTATALGQRARKVAVALDPEWAERRYRDAVHDRRVIGYLNDDGSATISGQRLDAAAAAAACAQVTALADAAKRAGAAATLDQLRADVFLGLLAGEFEHCNRAAIVAELLHTYPPDNHPEASETESAADPAPTAPSDSATDLQNDSDLPADSRFDSTIDAETDSDSANRAGVQVRVGLGTLLGIDEHPGEIAGWGAVPAKAARDTVARQRSGEWRYAIHDDHGQLLFDGTTRRRPTGGVASCAAGGIVELLVPEQLLTDATAREHPEWADLLTDLAKQHAARGWRFIRLDEHTFRWISPLGRRHDVRLPPVAPPLPNPIPRSPPETPPF